MHIKDMAEVQVAPMHSPTAGAVADLRSAASPMHLLTTSDSSVLNARFTRVLRVGLVMTALACVAWNTVSIVGDRRETTAAAEQGESLLAGALRIHVDQVMDQSSYSLRGVLADLRDYAVAAAPEPGSLIPRDVALVALRTAMRYDPASAVLFVRQGDAVHVVGRDGRPVSGMEARLRPLPVPAPRQAITVLPPLRGEAGVYYLPVILPTRASMAPGMVGALVPMDKFKEYGVLVEAASGRGDALYLLDGTVLARSAYEDQARGKRLPESEHLARQAARQPHGVLYVTGPSGKPLLVAYQRSERYPLLVASAQSLDAYLAPWVQRSAGKAVMLTLGLLAIGWFARSLFRLNAAMVSSEATYRELFQGISDAVLLTTENGRIAGLNEVALRLLGLNDAREAEGRDVRDFYRVTDAGQVAERPFSRALAGEHLRYTLSFLIPGTGQQIDADLRVSATEVAGRRLLMYIVRDISAERRHVRQQEYLASHDVLTGLPNRQSLLRALDRQIEVHPAMPVHLVLVNLLRFREINESFGPRAGDTVLEVCAQRLAKALTPMRWTLFRVSGTEFVAMGLGPRSVTELGTLRTCILAVLQERVAVADATVDLQARLGSTQFPDDALDASQLLRCAEIAALQARQAVDHWTQYTRQLDRTPGRDLKLRTELGTAIREGQLRLFYQPKLWLEDRGIAGAEALLRWEHPERGWVSPGEFIPLAEATDLIHPLTRWVLAEAIEQIHTWAKAGRPLTVAVNISANNLRDPDFTGHVKALLARRPIAPELLELEVTEGALAHNPEIVLRRLQELRDAGLGLSLDDFGTGFSSLAYVRQFPFTSIKIDRSFVDAMLSSPRDRQVTKSTITLGRELGLKTIAEGVENDETAAELLALECDIGQGYLFGRPMPAADFDRWRTTYAAKQARASSMARNDYNAR